MQPPLKTIQDVLDELDRIIHHCQAQGSLLGVFAYVYRRTTAKVKEALEEQRFQDNARMERFDVLFAQRYIDAYWQYQRGEYPTKSWQQAFSAIGPSVTLLQHTLLGMNAHINLDLGIVAAEIAPGDQIQEIKADFMLVNDLLQELVDTLQGELGRVSRLLILVDWLGGRRDEAYIFFSIQAARNFAWLTAEELAHLPAAARIEHIHLVDEKIAQLAQTIQKPPGRLLRFGLRLVQRFEEKEVGRIIQLLR